MMFPMVSFLFRNNIFDVHKKSRKLIGSTYQVINFVIEIA